MSITAGQIMIELAANVARLQSDMNSAKGMVGGAMKEISNAADLAKKALAALGVATTVAGLVEMVKGSINAAGALHDLSQKTGATVEALSAFQAVGKLSGTTADQIGSAMAKLAKNMAVANEDSKGTAQAIKALGLNFEDFRRLRPDEQMLSVAKAMDQFADGSGKTAVAMTLFGKAGAEMLPFLHDLAETGTLNAKITAEQAAMADNFSDNLVRLKASGEGWKRELAMGMLPALDQAARAFLDVMNGSHGLREEVHKLSTDGSISSWTTKVIVGLTYVTDMMTGVKRVFQTVGESFGAFAAVAATSVSSLGSALKKLAGGDFAGAIAEVRTGLSQTKAIYKDFGETLQSTWSEETIGQKIRARIAEVEKLGATSQAIKPQIDMRAEIEANTAATKAHTKAQDDLLEKIKVTAQYQLETITVTAKKIELDTTSANVAIAAAERAQEWAKMETSIFDGLTDAIYRSAANGEKIWASLANAVKGLFQNLVLQPTIRAVMGPVAGVMGGVMSGVGSAVAGTGGGGGGSGLLSGLGAIGGLTGVGSMFGSGLGFGLIGGFGGGLGLTGTIGAAGSMISGGLSAGMAGLGSTIAGVGAMLGAVAPIAAAVFAIYKGLQRGPKVVKEQGITGEIVGGDATAQLYEKWKQSGGWLVGGRKGTRYKDLGEELSAGLDQAAAGVYGQVAEWTKAIGLPAEKLAEVTHAISIKLGKDDAETQKNIEEAMAGYQEALAGRFQDLLEPFRNAGETLAETLQRLTSIQAMSEQLNQFGGVFSRIAALSVDAREELIGFAGGIEALLGKVQSFVSAYYSEGEQAAIAARQIRDSLAAMGITQDVSSKSDFRALVESLDVSNTEGRKQLDQLLTIAQTFAPVADYLGKAGGTLASLADQAPQSALLQSIFDASQVQGEAAARTADGVERVNDSITTGFDGLTAQVQALNNQVVTLGSIIADSLARNSRDVVGAIEANA